MGCEHDRCKYLCFATSWHSCETDVPIEKMQIRCSTKKRPPHHQSSASLPFPPMKCQVLKKKENGFHKRDQRKKIYRDNEIIYMHTDLLLSRHRKTDGENSAPNQAGWLDSALPWWNRMNSKPNLEKRDDKQMEAGDVASIIIVKTPIFDSSRNSFDRASDN